MHKQINQLRADLMAQFPERKDVIDGSLAAVLAGEHVLLIGPPGTAKSALVRCIAQLFGGSYFERLLTKFSTPEELFGPISLQGLAQDRFVRLTAGKLPEAEFAFVDEIFKSNSAVLNALLSIINERVFHNDGAPVRCPLVSLFAASNELPEGKELEALFDRFLLRFDVGYLLVASNLRGVLVGPEPAIAATLTMDELRRAQGEVAAVKITDDTVDALLAIRDACRGEGITASDRRWKKSLGSSGRRRGWPARRRPAPRISRSWSTACGASPRSARRWRGSSGTWPTRQACRASRSSMPRARSRPRSRGSSPATASSTSRRRRRRSSSSTHSRPSCRRSVASRAMSMVRLPVGSSKMMPVRLE
jgi:MoxR-like ATPase